MTIGYLGVEEVGEAITQAVEKTFGDVLLDVQDLRSYFFTRTGIVKAVDGVSFKVRQGETLGIVGESGCGKSVTCTSILQLLPQPIGKTISGKILFEGEDVLEMDSGELRKFRGRKVAMILQDPMTSLNPAYSTGDQVQEAVTPRFRTNKASLWDRVKSLYRQVGISSPEYRVALYPHELSGGMRQRVVGAMALASEPRLLIADEPTTSLDVTIQAQYLTLLKDLQVQTGVGLIFVTHDFGIVAKMCDTVAVMYAGRIIETGPVRDVFNNPIHPYTQALLGSVPKLEEKSARLYSIEGQPPSLYNIPDGCRFAPRCPYVMDSCWREYPPMVQISATQAGACWLQVDGKGEK